MKYFFNIKKNKEKLQKEIKGWIDTPYKHKMMRKGIGCDCIHFVLGVLKPSNILTVKRKDIPEYSRDRHLHNTHSLLVEHFCKHRNFVDVFEKNKINFIDGDILFFSVGKTIGHVGIFCDNLIYEATINGGVMALPFLGSPWHRRLKKVMRAII